MVFEANEQGRISTEQAAESYYQGDSREGTRVDSSDSRVVGVTNNGISILTKSRSNIEPETLLRQAGEARLREIITAGGFRNLRHAAETPFSMILEPDLELTRPAGHMARPG
jgi:hypothetical protein